MTEIVTGVDGSDGSAAALRWAVQEGRLRDRPVTAVLAWGLLDQHHLPGHEAFDPSYGDKEAQEALAAAVEAAVGAETAATVGQRVVCDLPARALIEASARADLLVVGARGLGGFHSLLTGSVSEQCLHHATCPVAVVRATPVPTVGVERIVIGTDGSDAAQAALHWALGEARLRHATVQLIHAWQPAFVGGDSFLPVPADSDAMAEVAEHLLERAVAAEDSDGIAIERTEVCAAAPSALMDAAAGASLVVVGSRGRGGFAGLLLGSVSQQVAQHAPCPVVVIPHGR
ncbi:MAG TPA: universal stress protein [Acidimicrobiales bacterium]|nr:universal stress protein [Acidimicrobiales bacterium]